MGVGVTCQYNDGVGSNHGIRRRMVMVCDVVMGNQSVMEGFGTLSATLSLKFRYPVVEVGQLKK